MDDSFNGKAALNLWCSKRKQKVAYDITGSGSSHNPTFKCQTKIESMDDIEAIGTASNKKTAANNAALEALRCLVEKNIITKQELSQPCFEVLKVKEVLFPSGGGGGNVKPTSVNVSNTNKAPAAAQNRIPPTKSSGPTMKSGNNAENINPNNCNARNESFWRKPLPHLRDHYEPPPTVGRRFQRPPSQQQPPLPPPPPCPRFRGGPPPGRYPPCPPPPQQHYDYFNNDFHPSPHDYHMPPPPPPHDFHPPPPHEFHNDQYGPPPPSGLLPPPHHPGPYYHHEPGQGDWTPPPQPPGPWHQYHQPRFPYQNQNKNRFWRGQQREDDANIDQMRNLNISEKSVSSHASRAFSDENEDSISIRQNKKPKFDTNSVYNKIDQIKNECNFTLDNSKQQLNIFIQLNRIKTDYEFESHGPPHSKTFMATLKFYSGRNKKEYFAKERGQNKQDASRLCALNILYQLYKDQMVSGFDSEALSKKQLLKTSWIYVLNVKKELADHLLQAYSYVQSYNQYTKIFKTPDIVAPKQLNSFLYWCPPLENFNPWLNSTLEGTIFEGKSKEDINTQLQQEFQSMIKSPKFQSVLGARMKLPIWEHKEKVITMIESNPVMIIKGSTGCGKTTQVSQFILDSYIKSGNGSNCNIIVTQPRRISAISIAERVAYERGEELRDGKSSVGFAVRFDHSYPRPYGSILFCTTGHLLRRIQGGLKGVSHLIIDEVHERDINTDLLLIIIRDLINLDLNIRIVIMSATLGVSHFQHYFNCSDVLQIESRVFPVERFFLEDTIEMIKWRPKKLSYMEDDVEVTDIPEEFGHNSSGQFDYPKSISQHTIDTLQKLKEGVICYELIVAILEYIHNLTITGSVLIFLPGWNAIFSLLSYLKQHRIFGNESKFLLLPLHSQLSHKDNNRIFVHSVQRKIILSTNIAETSITIDDVVFVIDSCLMKRKIYDPRTNCTSFVVDLVSKSNIQQRQGRAGRVRSGYFFVLCTKRRYEMLEEFKRPDILVSSLVETVLLIKHLGFGSVPDFLKRALDPPAPRSIQDAMEMLRNINAFDNNDELTPLGTILAKMPINPRIGRMIIEGILLNVASPVVTIAAASSINFEMFDNNDINLLLHTISQLDEERFSDHLIAFKVYSMCENMNFATANSKFPCVNMNAINVVKNARKQLVRILTKSGFKEDLFEIQPSYLYKEEDFDKISGLLITAFYPNVCIHKDTRRILTNEERIGLIHKTSVFYAYMNLQKLPRSQKLKSPMFVYSEKSQNKNLISSKQMTMVSFLQLMLFGIRTFEFPPNPTGNSIDTVLLDGWIEIKVDAQVFDCIWQMKTEFEQIITRITTNPDYQRTELDTTVLNAISQLCLFENISVEIIGKQS